MASIKYLLFAFVGMYFLVMGTSTVIDLIADSSKQSATTHPSVEDETSFEISQILAGADPTDVFEPTAAGRMLTPSCYSGQIETENKNLSSFNGTRFISRNFEGETYITLLTLPPIYLLQDENQVVSATRIDQLPPDLMPEMGQILGQQTSCAERSLFLSRID